MRVEQVAALVAVAGEMELDHAVARDSLDVVGGVEAVVAGANEDVVDVEENAAVGVLGDLAEEFPLAHGRVAKGDVGGDILERDLPAEELLHALHARDHVGQRLLGVG